MQIRIFTLPFDELSEGFPDEIVTEFCLNKKVYRLDTQFFLQDGRAFWTVAIHYEIVLKGEDKLRELDESQRLLFNKLKEWRKERAGKEGIPPYLVATNAQFLYMVKLKCRSLDCFKSIKGFGKKRIDKYGRRIAELIKAFYEAQPPGQPEESKADGLPF